MESKGDAINFSLKITQAYTKFLDVLFDEDQGIIVRQQKQMEAQSATNKLLISKIEKLEKQQIRSDQYSRKETIEMKGINPELPDREVEKKVIEVLNSIKSETDQPFTPEGIHACHKLKKIVICKFVSRRRMRANINNRSELKGKDLTSIGIRCKVFIYESMTRHFKNLNWRCNQLKKAGIIKDCWLSNLIQHLILLTTLAMYPPLQVYQWTISHRFVKNDKINHSLLVVTVKSSCIMNSILLVFSSSYS